MSHGTSRRKFWIQLIISVVFLIAIFSWSEGVFEKKVETDEVAGKTFERWSGASAVIRAETIPLVVEFAGTVRPREEAVVSARVAGEIEKVTVREGDRVRRGDLLVILSAPELASQAVSAAGASRGAEAALEQAGRDYERLDRLYREGAVSRSEWERAATALEAARADLDRTRGSTGAATTVAGYTRLKAPFDGLVVERYLDPGAFAGPGARLLKIEDDRTFRMEAAVPDRSVATLRAGDSITVILDTLGIETDVAVAAIDPASDPASHTVLVRSSLPTNSGLRSGLFGRLRFSSGERIAIVAPATAVREAAGLHTVRLLDENGRASTRPVKVGRKLLGGNIEILSGLAAGDRVALEP